MVEVARFLTRLEAVVDGEADGETQALLGSSDAVELLKSVRRSLRLLEHATTYFALSEICLSFNGGKDACVAMHLLRYVVWQKLRGERKRRRRRRRAGEEVDGEAGDACTKVEAGTQTELQPQTETQIQTETQTEAEREGDTGKEVDEEEEQEEDQSADEELARTALSEVRLVYFDKDADFPEVQRFLRDVQERFDLSYTVLSSSYKEGMAHLVEDLGVKAVVMGVRVGDPYTEESEHFQPSSSGWPIFLRVNPILLWDYGQVWTFLRGCDLPYCSLYEQGYTSIGAPHDTTPNAALQQPDGSFLPAYHLRDFALERANRTPTATPSAPAPSAARTAAAVAAGGSDEADADPVPHPHHEQRQRIVRQRSRSFGSSSNGNTNNSAPATPDGPKDA